MLLLAAALAGCGALPGPADTAQLPPGEFTAADPDVAAVNYATAAFSNQSSTYGNPAAGAEAALALEYSAGALNTEPRWVGLDPDVKSQLLQARLDLRAALGITPNAPSQTVVNALSAARLALQADDPAAAAMALRNPAFTLPPDKTIAILGNLPYLQPVNVATLVAQEAISDVASQPQLSERPPPL